MEKSTHKTEIVKVHLEPHPNADSLSVVHVFTGYTVVVRTEDWVEGQLAAYVVPDSMVPTKFPEFAFLAKDPEDPVPYRVRVKKLRGIFSQGLLVPISSDLGYEEGDDVSSVLGVTHYEPPILCSGTGGDNESAPQGFHPAYDVDSLRRYSNVFSVGEKVWVTEKIHGTNARYWYDAERQQMYAGSHHQWKKEDPDNLWWKALANYPEIEKFCKEYPECTIYAEVYGAVQNLRYGCQSGELRIAVYDILNSVTGCWLEPDIANLVGQNLPKVPFVGEYYFDLETILSLAEGPSLVPGADHMREGVVVKPFRERTHDSCGRVNLKVVSNEYLDKAENKRIAAEAKKEARKDRPELKHKHKWSVSSCNTIEPNSLSVVCLKCKAVGVVTDPEPGEIMEAWDGNDLPYPFRSDYRRVTIREDILYIPPEV